VGGLVILAIYPACRATVLGMTALKQMVFSLAFAIAAVAAAQYVMWILNGQPWTPWARQPYTSTVVKWRLDAGQAPK
jgi:hypothetical protein